MVRRTRVSGGPTGQEGKTVFARRPFVYTEDLKLARGQVFQLGGLRNDEKLVRLRYVDYVLPSQRTFQAPNGGPRFVDERARDDYQRELIRKQARADEPEDPLEEDRRVEAEERKLNEIAPLHIGGE